MTVRIVRPVGQGAAPVEAAPCTLLTPRFKECAPLCCTPVQCGQCPPQTRINDAIRISPEINETRLKVGTWGCEGMSLDAFRECIELRVRQRGWCPVVHVAKPYRATLDGEAVFRWGQDFWQMGEGYYEADVVVNGRACLTIGIWVPFCRHRLWSSAHTANGACDSGNIHPGALHLPPDDCTPALIDPVPAIPIPEGVCNADGCQ